jgi:hypothetical protein
MRSAEGALARRRAIQAADRRPCLGGRHGIDQLADGLRLHQVQLAVEHRPPGELARRGRTGAGGVESREEPRRRHLPAMAGELDHVLAGIAVGSGEYGVEPAVDGLSCVVEDGQRGESRVVAPEPFHHPGRDVEGPPPAQSHDRQRRSSRRSRERGDRIGEHERAG